jgi:hypothetical protein
MNIIPKEQVETINWEGHKDDYDVALFALGKGLDNFYIVNPAFPESYINAIDKEFKSSKCVLWKCDNKWIVKQFHKDWTSDQGWVIKEVPNLPKQHWKVNPDIDPRVTFKTDPYNTYKIGLWDLTYKHVWYLDSKYDPEGNKIWVYECVTDWIEDGTKEFSIEPELNEAYNKDYKHMSMNRQTGTTTFLITLAAYKSLKNETVSYFTFSEYHRKYCVGIYKRNMINFREKYPKKVWTQMEPFFVNSSDGIRDPSIALFDNWLYARYPYTLFNYLKSRDTKVFWMDTVEYDTV